MQDIIGIIEHEKELQLKHRERIVLSLRKTVPGHLAKLRNSYYWRRMEEGTLIQEYLGPETHPKVKRLKVQKYFREALKIIDKNINAIDKFLGNYENYDPVTISKKIGKTYQIPPDEVYEAMDLINPKDWDKNFWKEVRYEENLTMTTIEGHKVRSKSELVIANQLHLNNLKYRYECIFEVDGINLHPDFMILSPKDNEVYIWEHFGRMNDPVYRANALKKIYLYMKKGYYPWDKLIITFDDENKSLDSRIVSKLIDLYFM